MPRGYLCHTSTVKGLKRFHINGCFWPRAVGVAMTDLCNSVGVTQGSGNGGDGWTCSVVVSEDGGQHQQDTDGDSTERIISLRAG